MEQLVACLGSVLTGDQRRHLSSNTVSIHLSIRVRHLCLPT